MGDAFMQLFENTFIDRSRNAFANQFEAADAGYLFRTGQKGSAIPVTDEERDQFVKTYGIKFYAASFVFVAALLGTVFAIGTYTDQMENRPPDSVILSIVGGVCFVWLLIFCVVAQKLWKAPLRALSRRSVVRMERDDQMAAEAKLSKITWGQLAMGAVAVCFLVFKFGQKYDLTQGPGLIFSGLIALGSAVLIWQAFRKWTMGRSNRL
jgi:hypothetical protein